MLELVAQASAALPRFAKAGYYLDASMPPSQSHTELPLGLPGAGTPATVLPSLWQAQGDQ